MKKLIVTFMSIAVTSLFLVACGSDGGGSGPAPHPYPQCEGLSGYDYERCIEQYYPGSIGHTANYFWYTGNVKVTDSSLYAGRKNLEQFFLSRGVCNGTIDSDDLNGCKDMSSFLNLSLSTSNLVSQNQTVTVTIQGTTKRPFSSGNDRVISQNAKFSFQGRLYFEDNVIRIHAQPFLIVIQQNKLHESSFYGNVYIDGALLANNINFSYNSSGYYYNDNSNCTSSHVSSPPNPYGGYETGGTTCNWGWGW
ncbi:MAG: hypothetical protein MK008_02690 [Bdellovibrionales bacterium]|nr:hypothetical protein [Bdellovibrionales bacterium]